MFSIKSLILFILFISLRPKPSVKKDVIKAKIEINNINLFMNHVNYKVSNNLGQLTSTYSIRVI
jgi:hypothetical protein